MSRWKLPSEMAANEAMDYAAEHSAIKTLGQFSATNLLVDFAARNILELRRRLEVIIRVCVREAIDARECIEQIIGKEPTDR